MHQLLNKVEQPACADNGRSYFNSRPAENRIAPKHLLGRRWAADFGRVGFRKRHSKEVRTMLGAIVTIVVYLVAAALVLLVVSRLNLGLTVENFSSAIIAALIIAVVTGVLAWLLGALGITLGGTGLIAAIFGIIFSAIVLLVSDKFLPGMKVAGFGGAIIAAIAIGVVGWVLNWILSLIGIAPVV
jgi:putative membrane protein